MPNDIEHLLPGSVDALVDGASSTSTRDHVRANAPMVITVIGGLITSTLLSLLVVPVAFTVVDDAERAMRRLVGRQEG